MSTPTSASRVAFITGGASGIGLAVGALLQRRGYRLAVMDLAVAPWAGAEAALAGGESITIEGDVTHAADCERAVARTVERFGGIDLVWANAGVGSFAPLLHVEPLEWRRTVEVNVFGVLNTVHAALPHVIARRGQVAVSASAASFGHAPGMSAYAASKAAAEAMCDSWRIEMAHHGVAVTCIHPSWITTPMVERGRDSVAFARLRQAMPGPLRAETALAVAAPRIAAGLEARARRVFVPGWVRWLFVLRSLLHTRGAERNQVAAAADLERLYLDDRARFAALSGGR